MSAESSNKNSGLGSDMSFAKFHFLGIQVLQTVEKPRILECEGQGRLGDSAFGLSIWARSLGEGMCRGRNPGALL